MYLKYISTDAKDLMVATINWSKSAGVEDTANSNPLKSASLCNKTVEQSARLLTVCGQLSNGLVPKVYLKNLK